MKNRIHISQYCFIKPDYLKKFFTKDDLAKRKYNIRPFIYLKDLNIAMAIPEVTVHTNKRYRLNFYFSDEKHYINVPSLLFVTEQNIYFNKKFIKMNSTKEKLKELKIRSNELDKLIKTTLNLVRHDQSFKDEHWYISESQTYVLSSKKKFHKEHNKENEKEKEQSKGPELSM